MSFSRRGLDALAAAAQVGKIDAVLTKDLSRLGRHKTQTALFIDYLRDHQVRVISVTEGIDTFREEDDLILGVRGLMNDYYAKDIGKKRFAQAIGRNKKTVLSSGRPSDTGRTKIRTGFSFSRKPQKRYAASMRCICRAADKKEIARRLNALNCKTPAQLWTEQIGHDARRVHKTGDGKFLWTYASVKNILTEEAYTGALINHRREYRNGKAQPISTGDWLRHENFYPEIIEKNHMASGTGAVKAAGASRSRKPRKAPLCRLAVLSGLRRRLHPHDPLLERKPAHRVRLPWVSQKWKRSLQFASNP